MNMKVTSKKCFIVDLLIYFSEMIPGSMKYSFLKASIKAILEDQGYIFDENTFSLELLSSIRNEKLKLVGGEYSFYNKRANTSEEDMAQSLLTTYLQERPLSQLEGRFSNETTLEKEINKFCNILLTISNNLKKQTIFVFGSNLAGIHGAGAALAAKTYHGALSGVGVGLQGSSYAIPTKDRKIKTLPLSDIANYINEFKEFAKEHPEKLFKVTAVGTGLAGYKIEDIGPLFSYSPANCIFDIRFKPFIRLKGTVYTYFQM